MPPRKSAPRKIKTYHKGNVSRDLLAAAKAILKTESVEDVSVRRLAREIGVTPANFYNHFPSLDALLLTLAAESFDEVAKNIDRAMAKLKNRKEVLLLVSVQFVEFAIANKQIFRIMFGQIPNAIANEKFRLASDRSFGRLMHFIYGEDIFNPVDLPGIHIKGRAAYAVFAMVYGLARNIIEDQFIFQKGTRTEIRQFVEAVMSTFFDGAVAKELSD